MPGVEHTEVVRLLIRLREAGDQAPPATRKQALITLPPQRPCHRWSAPATALAAGALHGVDAAGALLVVAEHGHGGAGGDVVGGVEGLWRRPLLGRQPARRAHLGRGQAAPRPPAHAPPRVAQPASAPRRWSWS